MSAVLDEVQSAVEVRELEVGGAEGPLAARLYLSKAPGAPVKRDTLVVFFHGGGFVSGDLQEADEFLRYLTECDASRAVLASNYTLATVKPFPAAVEDAHAVLLWANKHKAKLGWSGKKLVVAGIEAGANLAAVCGLMARDRAAPKLAGQILIMPMLDPGLSTCSMRQMNECPDREKMTNVCAEAYRGYLPHAADRAHPYASPLRSTRLKNLPPALILSAEGDPLCDEAEQYGAKLINAGVRTTVRRMPPAPLADPGGRNDCACKVHAMGEIATFLAALDR
jgi:acetyl esterase